MKIQSVTLRNFALIKSAMGLNEINLDFTNAPYRLNLIIGNNGTGKTALLSNLHPFAYLGNLESRDDSDLIIPGLSGYKHIVFKDDDNNVYDIEHHYLWRGENKSRVIDSFIMKNRVELNGTGSVTTFKNIINKEFDIDMNYLKLIRLGTNVDNFIEMKSNERKVFISKILEDIKAYEYANKIVSSHSTELNTALKIAINKKNKLGIDSIEKINTQIENKKSVKEELNSELEKVYKELYTYDGNINKNDFDEYNESNLSLIKESINMINDRINKLIKPKRVYINPMNNTNIIDRHNKDLQSLNELKTECVKNIAVYDIKLNEYKENIKKLENRNSAAISKIELQSINDYINNLTNKIKNIDKIYNFSNNNTPIISKKEIDSDMYKIKDIVDYLKECINFNALSRTIFIDLFIKSKEDFYSIYNNIKEDYNNTYSELIELKKSNKFNRKHVLFIPRKCTCYADCPFYNSVYNNLNIDNIKEKINTLELYLENLDKAKEITDIVYSAFKIFNTLNSDRMKKCYNLNKDNFLNAIYKGNMDVFINIDLLNKLITIADYYEDYKEYNNKLELTKLELDRRLSKSNSVTKEDIEYEISAYNKTVECIEKEKVKEENKLKIIEGNIENTKRIISDYNNMLNYTYTKKDLNKKLYESKNKFRDIKRGIDIKKEYDSKINEFKSKIDNLKDRINKIDSELEKLMTDRINFTNVSNEIVEIENEYDKIKYIKNATSSTNGIPLIYIQRYCSKLCNIANIIISKIYNGDLRLLDFKITEESFKIPYTVKGITIKDIKDASQAEISIIKVAISFAILALYMTKYNIILLDEIDSPMHKENKEKFISAIEDVLDIINCEQAFIITQSTLFNKYPVNLLITDENYTNKYNINKYNDNIVFSK